ncbi:hypothetical protein AgCh_022524 [Apium graveolens]
MAEEGVDRLALMSKVSKSKLKEKSEWTTEEKVVVLKDAKAKFDESLTDIYDRFLTLPNNLSLVGNVYDLEDSNTKFRRALNEELETRTSIIRHQYDLEIVTLDEIYGMLRTHDLEVQQRKEWKSNKGKSVALKMNVKPSKDRKSQKKRSFRKKFTGGERKSFGRREGKDSKAGKVDRSKIKYYNYDEPGHFATECKKTKHEKGKNKALITSIKDWMDSTDSENEETCYTLMASFDTPSSSESKLESDIVNYIEIQKECEKAKHTAKILEAKYSMLENELQNERKTLKAWTVSGKKVHEMISKKNWKECLGYVDGVKDVNTKNKITLKTPVKFISSEADEPKSTFEKGSTSASQEKVVNDKTQREENKETIKAVKKEKNIGLLSKRQLKKKLSEVTDKPQVKSPKRNRNGKQGISKDSTYKFVPNAHRKTYFNYGNTNHLAIDYKRSKKMKTVIPESDVRGRSVFYKP